MMPQRLLVPLTLVLAFLLAFAAGVSAAPSAANVPVSAVNFQFQPRTVTINVGDTVVWTNNDAVEHTVTASDGSWDSGLFGQGQTFSRTFDTAGTFNYYCRPHGSPDGSGMAGVVVVRAAAAPGAPQPTPGVLPSTGDAGPPSDLWILVGLASLLMLGGGALIRARTRSRRTG